MNKTIITVSLAGAAALLGFLWMTAGSRTAAPRDDGHERLVDRTSADHGPGTPRPVLTSDVATAPLLEASRDLTAANGTADPAVYHPRDDSEWQGMLVDTSRQAFCEAADSCGLAMACNAGKCGPCQADDECAGGERCVLDHCVLADNVECTSAADCAGESFCVLSGYSSDPRNNAGMRAHCLETSGGQAQAPVEPEAASPEEPERAPTHPTVLVNDLENAVRDHMSR